MSYIAPRETEITYDFRFDTFRDKPFVEGPLLKALREEAKAFCKEEGYRLVFLKSPNKRQVEVRLRATPEVSPHLLVNELKNRTGRRIRNEFAQVSNLPGVWTRYYDIATVGFGLAVEKAEEAND